MIRKYYKPIKALLQVQYGKNSMMVWVRDKLKAIAVFVLRPRQANPFAFQNWYKVKARAHNIVRGTPFTIL